MIEAIIFAVAWLMYATVMVVIFPLRVLLWVWDRIAPDRDKPGGGNASGY